LCALDKVSTRLTHSLQVLITTQTLHFPFTASSYINVRLSSILTAIPLNPN